MLGFSLARIPFLNISGDASSSFKNKTLPGEWYNYTPGRYLIGISLHLVTIIPAGFLMIFQFVPIIRYKAILFHRVNGYIIILLVLLGNAGAAMIAPRAFGGTITSQAAVWILIAITTTSMVLAYVNIKKLQIEQHRAWMLRAMFYLGTIITVRLIMIISAQIMSISPGFYGIKSCGQIAFMHSESLEATSLRYSACATGDATTKVAVPAKFGGEIENIAAALTESAGMALWLALVLHLVGVEIYLALTPKENERLRNVSYVRQMEAGYKNPGRAGLTADRLGDAEIWIPKVIE